MTDGAVHATAQTVEFLYLGGDFSYVGPYTGGAVPLNADGNVMSGSPSVHGSVRAIARDGSGGWYLGGVFDSVGNVPRSNVAHVRSDLSVVSWASVTGTVNAIVVRAGTIYLGGSFTAVNGQPRANLAAVDTAGTLTSWNPGTNNPVLALAVSGSRIYVGGQFTTVGDSTRNRIAAVDALTGIPTTWNPGANGDVLALLVHFAGLYAGGQFTFLGGVTRNRIAALDSVSGQATSWNPNANGAVRALTAIDTTIYAGGDFTSIGGQSRNHLAALRPNGLATGFIAALSSSALETVRALATDGFNLYAGGSFKTIGGVDHLRIAEFDRTTGTVVLGWSPHVNGDVLALAASPTSSTVYAGGDFASAGGSVRHRLAEIDIGPGYVTGWDPNPNGSVRAIAVSNGVAYVGGYFDTIGVLRRRGIAAVSVVTGQVTSWDPNPSGNVQFPNPYVLALVVSGQTVWAGGYFTSIAGQTRTNVAPLDATTGAALPFALDATNNDVYALALSGSTLYVGGVFDRARSQPRNFIAALTTTGALSTWNPNAISSGGARPGAVHSIVVDGGTVYAGGYFTAMGQTFRNNLAAVSASTAIATTWNPDVDFEVYAMALSGISLYAGGNFSNVGGQFRSRIAAIDLSTGAPHAWNPVANGEVLCLALNQNALFAGGLFTSMDGAPTRGIAQISPDNGCPDITLSDLPDGAAGVPYSSTVIATAGTPPYSFFVTSGSLPPGLTLSGDGSLSGTPTTPGVSNFTIQVFDNFQCSGSRQYTMTIVKRTTSWTNAVNGNWSVAANWTAGVPGPDANVVVSVPGTYTVTLDVDATVASLTLGGGTLSATSRTLTLNGASAIQAGGQLSMRTSTLAGTGSLSNSGVLSLAGGTVQIPVDNSASIIITGNTDITGAYTSGSNSLLRVQCLPNSGNHTLNLASGFINNGTVELVNASTVGAPSVAILNLASDTLVNAAGREIASLGNNSGAVNQLNAQLDNQGIVTMTRPLSIGAPGAAHRNSGSGIL